MSKKILIIGGAGYVGSILSKKFANLNYEVIIYDLLIYNVNFDSQTLKKIKITKGDIRNLELLSKTIKTNEIDYIIHLACISNDPSFDLDPDLGKSINYDCFEPLLKISKDSGVKKFIYASSSSVYGVQNFENVTEECAQSPLTDYSKYKSMCEDMILKYCDQNFTCVIVRPATICGYSPRQRFDLIVNILTNSAYNLNKILIHGGSQLRPNIHIDDMCDAYIKIINSDGKIVNGQAYNVGCQNNSVEELALLVKKKFSNHVVIEKIKTNDNRSYHISSKKIFNDIGFAPQKNIEIAVEDLIKSFNKNLFKRPLDNEMYFNIKRMKSIQLR